MAEPASTVVTVFSISKLWSIIASICGSIIPVFALSDKHKLTLRDALIMAISGSSFAIFVGPWVATYINVTSMEGIAGFSWVMGACGVYVIRAVLGWLDKRGVSAVDRLFTRVTGSEPYEEDSERREDNL